MVFLLVDMRHDPSENDMIMYDYLMSKNYLFCVVATKADKLSPTAVKNQTEKFSEIFGVEVIPFTSEKVTGVDTVKQIIEDSVEDLPRDNDDV